jgi:hypothetical protein
LYYFSRFNDQFLAPAAIFIAGKLSGEDVTPKYSSFALQL